MLSGVSAHRWTALPRPDGSGLPLPSLPSHELEANSPLLCSPNPATLGGTACATETPGWRSLRAPEPPALPIPLPPTSVRRSAVSPLPPTAVVWALGEQPPAPKCPRIPPSGHHHKCPLRASSPLDHTPSRRSLDDAYLKGVIAAFQEKIAKGEPWPSESAVRDHV